MNIQIEELKKYTQEGEECVNVWKIGNKAQKEFEKSLLLQVDLAIRGAYRYLDENSNKNLGATGGSTYPEVQSSDAEKVVTMITKLKWIKARGDGTTTTDLGAGYNVFMAHLAQCLPQITVVGIENCVLQAYGYAAGMRNFLSPCVILENSKFSYLIAPYSSYKI